VGSAVADCDAEGVVIGHKRVPSATVIWAAVIEFPFMRLKGWLAWWIWGVAHIYFLVGVPSALVVSLRWLWEYLTYGRGARLITGSEHAD
jgi:NADH dehydrogenase FAD-containing subunit